MFERHVPRLWKAIGLLLMGCGVLWLLGSESVTGWEMVAVIIFSAGCLVLYLVEGYLLGLAGLESKAQAEAEKVRAFEMMTLEQRSLYREGFTPVKESTKIVFNSEVNTLSFMRIPLDERRLKILARGLLDGQPFSGKRWVDVNHLMSDPEFRVVQDYFEAQTLAVLKKQGAPQQGYKMTAKGDAAMRMVLGKRPEKIEKPPLLKDLDTVRVGVLTARTKEHTQAEI